MSTRFVIGNPIRKRRMMKEDIMPSGHLRVFTTKEAVHQFKKTRKRKANRALNPKRSKIFGVKINCGTTSKALKELLERYNFSVEIKKGYPFFNRNFIGLLDSTLSRSANLASFVMIKAKKIRK